MLELSDHAKQVLQERNIDLEWVEYVFQQPILIEPDVEDETLRHYFSRIESYGNRVLHVVLNVYKNPPHVVTAYFDRGRKNMI